MHVSRCGRTLGISMAAGLALCGATNGALGQARQQSPLWGDLTPGAHAVGFKVARTYDYARVSTRKRGYDGARVAGERARPLVIAYWYPATPVTGARRMTVERYLDVDEGLANPSAEERAAASQELRGFFENPFNFAFGRVPDDKWARLMSTSTAAVAEAPAKAGAFPLVVGVGGRLGNAVLAEYLASHGYIVALTMSPNPPVDVPPAAQMDDFVRDIEFTIAHLRTAPGLDRDRLATFGFSFAGMPALLTAMRSTDVDAVVALESGIFSQQFWPAMRASPWYNVTAVTVPFLHLMRKQLSDSLEQLEHFEQMRYAKRYRYLLTDPGLAHQDFGTHGPSASEVLEMRPQVRASVRAAQVANAGYILRFLNAYVKGDSGSLTFLARTPEANGVPRGQLIVETRDALRRPPTPGEFMTLATRTGMADALALWREVKQADPAALVVQENTVNALGYQLLQAGRRKEAIQLFELNVESHPQSANTYDSLSEAYEADGNTARAVETARQTLEKLDGDQQLSADAKVNLRRIAGERVRRLGGE